jgi:hypothetical protein
MIMNKSLGWILSTLFLLTSCSSNQSTTQPTDKSAEQIPEGKTSSLQQELKDYLSLPEENNPPSSSKPSFPDAHFSEEKEGESSSLFLRESFVGSEQSIDEDKLQDPLSRLALLCARQPLNNKDIQQDLDRLYSTYKKEAAYWNLVGLCFFHQGKMNQAKLYLNKALQVQKDYPPALNNMALILIRSGKDQQAYHLLSLARDKNPYALTPLINMAFLDLKYGFAQSAQQRFSLLEEKNTTSRFSYPLALTHLLLGRAQEAKETLLPQWNNNELSPEQRMSLGLVYIQALKYLNEDELKKTIFKQLFEISTQVSPFLQKQLDQIAKTL